MEKKRKTAVTKRYSLSEPVKLQQEPAGTFKTALNKLKDHLDAKHKKHTPEREYILDILYRAEVLLDPLTLHQLVCEQHNIVSTASVYNTLQLLLEIGVIRKIILRGDGQAFYERSLGNPAHPFAVCPNCGTVWSLPAMEFEQQLDDLLPSRFSPLRYSIIVDGICQKCHMKQKKEEAATELAYQKALVKKQAALAKKKKRKITKQ